MKVLLGLSGGVDSSVAAYLLKQEGFEVTAGFMRNWEEMMGALIAGERRFYGCCSGSWQIKYKFGANELCSKIQRKVFSYFLEELNKGKTPNPDIYCNKYIKFKEFTDYAFENGYDAVATGHYSKIQVIDREYFLCKSYDQSKDQTYF